MMNALPLNLALTAGARVHASVEWMLFVKCCTTKQYVDVCQGTVEDRLQDARVNCYGSSNLVADSVVGWLFVLPYFLNCILLLSSRNQRLFTVITLAYNNFPWDYAIFVQYMKLLSFKERKLYVDGFCSYKSMPWMYSLCKYETMNMIEQFLVKAANNYSTVYNRMYNLV